MLSNEGDRHKERVGVCQEDCKRHTSRERMPEETKNAEEVEPTGGEEQAVEEAKPEATINTNNDAKDDCSDLTDNNHETDEQVPKSFPQKVCSACRNIVKEVLICEATGVASRT